MTYIEKIKKCPFMENEIREDISKDKNIEMLRNIMTDIYMKIPMKILVEAESEEEMERLELMWRLKNVGERNQTKNH